MPIKNVIIAGAGPSGLLLALLLARHPSPDPIQITLFDAAEGLDPRPRAAYYGPAAIDTLSRAGVLADMRARGFDPRWMTWKKLWSAARHAAAPGEGAELLAKIDLDSGWDRQVCLALDELGALLAEHLGRCANARIVWGARVVGVGGQGEGEAKAWVDVEMAGEEGAKRVERREADFVVGCDGASSQVRRLLFGEKAGFPGRTWDEQIVAANVYYDFTKWGYHDVQFFIHPEHFHMVARLCGPPREYWRVSYGERSGLTHEQLLERVPEKFAAMLPGNPQPGDYEVVGFSPYRVHQRLAPSMRVGRVLLAADAAHLCNPFGGLGLTGGIVDVGGLYDCLAGIHDGLADESILDVYSDVRRKMWTDVIDPISSENIRRLFAQDPEKAAETDEFLKLVNRVEKDEELRKQFRAVSDIPNVFFFFFSLFSSFWRGKGIVQPVVGIVALCLIIIASLVMQLLFSLPLFSSLFHLSPVPHPHPLHCQRKKLERKERECADAEAGPWEWTRARRRQSLHAIEYDFKQHYRNAEAANGQDGAAKEAEKSEDVAISGAVAA